MAQRERLIALNANSGALVTIAATGPTRGIEFMEDEAAAPQVITFKTFVDGFVAVNTVSFGSEPIEIPSFHKVGDRGPLLGMNTQNAANGTSAPNYRAADNLVQARSNTATATTLRFIEYD
jgi:hypothetical protein